MVIRCLIALVLLTGCTHQAVVTPQDSSLELAYQQQLELTQSTPELAQFITLKQRYIATSRAVEPVILAMLDTDLMLITTDDHQRCLAQAQHILARHYVNINAHFAAMACAYDIGAIEQAQQSETALNQLLAVIWESGNGETALHAFQVLNVAEMHSFIHLQGLAIVEKTRLSTSPTLYRLTLVDEATQTRFQWFFKMLTA